MCPGTVLNAKGSEMNWAWPLPFESSQLSDGGIMDMKTGNHGTLSKC